MKHTTIYKRIKKLLHTHNVNTTSTIFGVFSAFFRVTSASILRSFRVISASLPRLVRVVSAFRPRHFRVFPRFVRISRGLDKHPSILYNSSQNSLSRAVRRTMMKLAHLVRWCSRALVPKVLSKRFHNLQKEVTMTAHKHRTSYKVGAALASAALLLTLAACGGGGGATAPVVTPPTPVTATVTCPNGSSSSGTGADTSAATAAANTACPAGKVTSVTPQDGTLSVSPDTFTGVVVATDSVLDPSTLNTTNIVLKAGSASTGTTVTGGSVTPDGTKGWKFAVAGKLAYAQPYAIVATVKDALGRAIQLTSNFTTLGIVCPPGSVLQGGTCAPVATAWWPPKSVAAIGVKTFNPAAPPMDGLKTPDVGGVIWQNAVIDGTIKLADTGMVLTGFSSKSLLLAYFIDPFTKNVCTTLIYKDDGSSIYQNSQSYGGCKTDVFDWIIGTPDGFIAHFPAVDQGRKLNICYRDQWNSVTKQFTTSEVTCP